VGRSIGNLVSIFNLQRVFVTGEEEELVWGLAGEAHARCDERDIQPAPETRCGWKSEVGTKERGHKGAASMSDTAKCWGNRRFMKIRGHPDSL